MTGGHRSPAWLACLCALGVFLGARPNPGAPPGFYLIAASKGIALYRSEADFVQVIDLSQGAFVRLLHGEIADHKRGQGLYGGDNPEVWRSPLKQAWDDFAYLRQDAFCITNGQFFSSTLDNPTPLALPLKKNGDMISSGYGVEKYKYQQLMLEIWPDRADIVPLNSYTWRASSAPNILGGLPADVGTRPEHPTGRTFVGVKDGDGDGRYEIVLIFNSELSTQPHAADVLKSFGADKVMMLDGGDSTQLICQDRLYIQSKSERAVPQMLATTSSPVPQTFCTKNLWLPAALDLMPGHQYKVVLQNSAQVSVRLTLSNNDTDHAVYYWQGQLEARGSGVAHFISTNVEGGNAKELYVLVESMGQLQTCVQVTVFDVTPCYTAHLVQPNDTLFSIARRYAKNVWLLAHVNNISNPAMIFAGRTVCIP